MNFAFYHHLLKFPPRPQGRHFPEFLSLCEYRLEFSQWERRFKQQKESSRGHFSWEEVAERLRSTQETECLSQWTLRNCSLGCCWLSNCLELPQDYWELRWLLLEKLNLKWSTSLLGYVECLLFPWLNPGRIVFFYFKNCFVYVNIHLCVFLKFSFHFLVLY